MVEPETRELSFFVCPIYPIPKEAGKIVKTALFIGGSAASYAIAMILMKALHLGDGTARFVIAALVALTMAYAVFLEFEALRSERLAVIYVAILGIECVLIAVASVYWFGEQFMGREVAGMALVVAGTALVWA